MIMASRFAKRTSPKPPAQPDSADPSSIQGALGWCADGAVRTGWHDWINAKAIAQSVGNGAKPKVTRGTTFTVHLPVMATLQAGTPPANLDAEGGS